jgi:hypothetical protein
MDDNEAIFKRILDDPEFREVLMDSYAAGVCRKASEAAYCNEDDPGSRRTTTLIQRCSSPCMRGHGGMVPFVPPTLTVVHALRGEIRPTPGGSSGRTER